MTTNPAETVVNEFIAAIGIGITGGMTQQVLHGRLARGAAHLEFVGIERRRHARILQLRQIRRHGIGEQDAALLHQHHDGN